MAAQFVYRVTVAARGRVQRDPEHGADRLKGESFPEFEVEHGALLFGQQAESRRHLFAEHRVIAGISGFEHRACLVCEAPFIAAARLPASEEIAGLVVGESQQEAAFVAHVREECGLACQFQKHLLQHVARVRFVAGEVQEEPVQRIGVPVINLCKGLVQSGEDARRRSSCLEILQEPGSGGTGWQKGRRR